MALTIAIACLVFSFDTLYSDCRTFKVYKDEQTTTTTSSATTADSSSDADDPVDGFHQTVTAMLSVFGNDSVASFRMSNIDEDTWEESEAVFFGVTGFAFVDYDEATWLGVQRYECHDFVRYDDDDAISAGEERYYTAIRVLQTAVPYLGITGMVLASIELFCCHWYPTVVAGAFFLAVAGCCELTYLILYVTGLKAWYVEPAKYGLCARTDRPSYRILRKDDAENQHIASQPTQTRSLPSVSFFSLFSLVEPPASKTTSASSPSTSTRRSSSRVDLSSRRSWSCWESGPFPSSSGGTGIPGTARPSTRRS